MIDFAYVYVSISFLFGAFILMKFETLWNNYPELAM